MAGYFFFLDIPKYLSQNHFQADLCIHQLSFFLKQGHKKTPRLIDRKLTYNVSRLELI